MSRDRIFTLLFDDRETRRWKEKVLKTYEQSAKQTIVEVTKWTERRLEEASGNLGRLSRAWSSKVYPTSGNSLEAAGLVYVKGSPRTRKAMNAFATGETVRPTTAKMLAIPLPAAGKARRGEVMTPDYFERRHNVVLKMIRTSGGKIYLIAVGRVNSKGQARRASATSIKTGRGLTSIPVFVLVPSVDIRQRFSTKPIFDEARQRLRDAFTRRVQGAGITAPPA